MTKLVIVMKQEELEKIMDEPDTMLSEDIWVGQEQSNKALDNTQSVSEDEVVFHVTIDSVYRATSILKFKKIEVSDD